MFELARWLCDLTDDPLMRVGLWGDLRATSPPAVTLQVMVSYVSLLISLVATTFPFLYV